MADEIESDGGDDKLVIGRGPSYPFIDLRKAVERVHEITAKGAERTKLAPESFYKFWNYRPKSSGARQTMAAMNAYDLVEYVGRGKDRRVQLSECARRIALDRRPNSPERAKALREAALSPPAFRDLWDHFGPHLPDPDVMTSWLVLDKEFNQSGADAAVANFIATVEYADLAKPDNLPDQNDSQSSQGVLQGNPPRVGDLIEVEVGGSLVFEKPVRIRAITDDGEWVFVEGSESGIPMEQVEIIERGAAQLRTPPTLPLTPAPAPTPAAAETRENDIKPLFDFDSVTINTKITSQWHLTQLISRLEKLKSMLPLGAAPNEEG